MRRLAASAAGPQLLVDPGFEKSAAWLPYGQGFTREHGSGHTGRIAIRCASTNPAETHGATQTVVLNQPAPRPILAVGWSRCRDVSGASDSDYSLYLDLIYQDGTPLWGRVAEFHTGTHGWERRQVLILPEKPVRSVQVYALFRHHTGTAWFDDFTLTGLKPGKGSLVFDGVPVSSPPARAKTTPHSPLWLGGGPLRLALNRADGRPIGMAYKGRSILKAPGPGLFARDAGADSDFYSFQAPLRRTSSKSLAQTGRIASLGLRLYATYQPLADGIEVSVRVDDLRGKDRAITLYYALPAPPGSLVWWHTLREPQRVQPGGIYADTVDVGVGNTGQISKTPFTCLQSPTVALSLAVPMDQPQLARMVYDASAHEFYLACDVGIAHPAPAATVRFFIYATDPSGGLRAAAKRYYDLFPDWFTKRAKREGIWMPFTPISHVPHPEDFGFAFKEGNDETAWDDAHQVATFRYTEPMSWWMNMPSGLHRTYGLCTQYLNRYAQGRIGNAETRQYARATLTSGDATDQGQRVLSIVDEPWAKGALFIDNCNPRLPDSPDFPNRAHVAWTPKIAHALYDNTHHGIQDGEYLDSLEGWANTQNYRRSQFRYESVPLAYDTQSKRPCILQAASTYEFTRWIAADVHHRGKLMFANSTPWRFFWYAPFLDVMGTETQWLAGDQYRPESDEIMLYRRLLCYHKPYLLLMNVDFNRFTHPMVEKYMKRCLLYGIFPSMFSYNAADKPYWQNPAWYNRDRDLFKRYIPIIRELDAKGWEPVTNAHADSPDVWIERYGGEGSSAAAYAIFNSGSKPRDIRATLTGPKRRAPAVYIDRVSGQRLTLASTGVLRLHLEPQDVAALFPASANH